MIAKCREHQLWADEAPAGIALGTWLEGYVDILYGDANGNRNAGSPYLMKLLSEDVVEYPVNQLAGYDFATFGDYD